MKTTHELVGKTFFDELVAHEQCRDAFRDIAAAKAQAVDKVTFGGIEWELRHESDGSFRAVL